MEQESGHPHVHVLVADGALAKGGEFLHRPYFGARLVEEGFKRLVRYLTRGPLPLDVVEKVEGGRLFVRTPPDPRTGLVEKGG